MSNYGIFDGTTGNALGFYDTREEAEEAFAGMVEADPTAERECVIIDFPDEPSWFARTVERIKKGFR